MYYVDNNIYAELDRTFLNIILSSRLYDKACKCSTRFLDNILNQVLTTEKLENIVIMNIPITIEESKLILENYNVPPWALFFRNSDSVNYLEE